VICEYPLKAMLEFHRARKAEATILVTRVDDPSKYGVVVIDEAFGQVQRFVEKPKVPSPAATPYGGQPPQWCTKEPESSRLIWLFQDPPVLAQRAHPPVLGPASVGYSDNPVV
jgi:ADP-glucose pyrophosphorylase